MPPPPPFAAATAVRALDANTYEVTLDDDWCIGSVPHGGYVLATLLRAAAAHLARTPATAHQPHTMTAQALFARRTAAGPAQVRVRTVRPGRATSTVHVALRQNGRDLVLAYLTQADLRAERGVGFPTGWALAPPPPPADVARLRAGSDANWAEQTDMPFAAFRRASQRVRFWFPRGGQRARGSNDQWMCLREAGGRFDNAALGFVADMFPQVVEGFNEEEDPYLVREKGVVEKLKKDGRRWARYWYPTVTMNLDVKKALPEGGVEFLFCRTSAKMIRNGRLDLEVVVLDEGGDLVAVSNHVVMVLSAGRNLAGRDAGGKDSKI
jgi:hypothetical protein